MRRASPMEFAVRRARASDKEPLMGFIKDVWGGHDYIPHVWDEWIADRSAPMYVVEVEGRAVGLNRVRFLEDGSAWFEGVRVHPDFRGQGLATALGENAEKVAVGKGVKTFRLTSSSWNKAAHRQIARMKFNEECRISVYEPGKEASLRPQSGARRAEVGDVAGVARTVRKSEEFGLGKGVAWEGFAAYSLTPRLLKRRVKEGTVFLLDDSVAIVKPGREGRNVWNQISFLCGEPADAVRLARHVFCTSGKADWNLAYMPQRSPIIRELRKNGFRRSFSLVLFQRSAAKG